MESVALPARVAYDALVESFANATYSCIGEGAPTFGFTSLASAATFAESAFTELATLKSYILDVNYTGL